MEINGNTKIEELEQKVNELVKELDKLKRQGKIDDSRFIPENDEKFWVINMWGRADGFVWHDGDEDFKYLLDNSPLFRTKEEAEKYLEFKQELAKRRWFVAKSEWENRGTRKYYIEVNGGEIGVDYNDFNYYQIGEIYFRTREDAEYIANNFKEELLQYWS